VLAVAGLLAVPLHGGCTGDAQQEAEQEKERTSARTPVPTSGSGAPRLVVGEAPVRARVVRVAGDLTAAERTQVKDNIGRVVGDWFDAAYLGGELRDGADLAAAFEVFTPAAAQQAARQADVTTGRVLAAELDQVVPTTQRVEAAVFASGRGPAGATAKVTLVLVGARNQGEQVEQVVRGELFLTVTTDGWRVFGFDLSRSVGEVGSFARAEKRAEGGS